MDPFFGENIVYEIRKRNRTKSILWKTFFLFTVCLILTQFEKQANEI